MDQELLAHFRRLRPTQLAAPRERRDHPTPVMTHIVERLRDYPAMVFSRFGEVLAQTRTAVALFGDYTQPRGSSRYLVKRSLTDPATRDSHLVQVGVTDHHRLRCYRHADVGELELYRQLLLDPVANQMLLLFTAVAGSPSDKKLRHLAAPTD